MKKTYHEHCYEEHQEALLALSIAKNKTQENITISYVLTSTRKPTISVPRHKLKKVLDRLKKEGREIITVNGKPYKNGKRQTTNNSRNNAPTGNRSL